MEFLLETKANLMTYNTFTFKTEAQMLLFIRMWEDNGTALFDKLKKKGCTRFCLNQIWNVREHLKRLYYLNTKVQMLLNNVK